MKILLRFALVSCLFLGCGPASPDPDGGGGHGGGSAGVEVAPGINGNGTFLEEIYGSGEQRVNSTHHQAVNQIGRKLRISAKAHDGVVEAIETTDPSWFCVGLQWHPECDTASALDQQIFECFVQASVRFVAKPMLVAA